MTIEARHRALSRALVLFCALFLLWGLTSPGMAKAAEKNDLTLMVYMCGSNLESQYGSASADYLEMTEAGVESGVSVLVMMGGSTEWKIAVDAQKTNVMEISGRGARKIREEEKKNMGAAETLEDFLRYGTERCPANRYALILWDHGGGPLDGLCWDEQYDADHLTLEELAGALQGAGFGEENRLAWIGFDACLMSSVEVGAAMAPYAGHMISSQAEEPSTGWNYEFLRGLSGGTEPEETGRRVIESYFAGQEDSARDLTMACIDLDGIGDIAGRMNDFFSALSGQLTAETFPDISRMRISATGFGRAGEQQPGENGYDLVDLVSLAESYAAKDPEKAETLIGAVRRAVVHQRSNLENSCGLSVYHPWRNREKYRDTWRALYDGISFSSGYARYISAYGRIMMGEQLVLWTGLDRMTVQSDSLENRSWISAELSAEQAADVAGASLVILARNLYDAADESYYLVYRSPDVEKEGNRLIAAYDGRHIRAMNETGYVELTGALSYQMTEDGICQIRLYPFDEEGNRSERPVIAEYMPDEENRFHLRDYLAYDELTGSWSSRADVDLSRYAGVSFINEYRIPTLNEQGEKVSFEQWRTDAHTDTHRKARYDENRTDFQIAFGKDLLRAESLYAAFEITDVQGNRVMTELVPLEEGGAVEYPVSAASGAGLMLEDGTSLDPACSLFLLRSANLESARIVLNLTLANRTDQNISFLLTDVRLNGKNSDAGALSAQGSGAADQTRRKSLAPGETGAASLILRYEDIAPLIPDVVLTDIGFSLFLGVVENGENQLYQAIPYELKTEIPLTAFYPETDVLPPAALIEAGKEIGALSAETEKTLFSHQGFRVSLRGWYAVDRTVILLLHYENGDVRPRHLFLGDAKMDGQEAVIGLTKDPGTESRNRRIRTYALNNPLWDLPQGVYQILETGESADGYVALKPKSSTGADVKSISFRALWYDVENPLDAVCFSEAVIATEEAAPLAMGTMAIAPAEDYTVSPGQLLPPEEGKRLYTETVSVAEGASPVTVRFADPEGDPIAAGYYVLFRRVSSDAELASMNIMNATDGQTGEAIVSFREGKEWLIFEALGELAGEAGGVSGRFPGLLPAVRAREESMRLTPVYLFTNEDGNTEFDQIGNHLGFGSVTFPGAVLETALGYLSVCLNPDSGKAVLTECKQMDGAYPSLAETVTQRHYLIPADAEEQEMIRFLNGDLFDAPYQLRQYLLTDGEPLSFSLAAVTDPERYEVAFLYVTEGNELRCSRPVPLNSFRE